MISLREAADCLGLGSDFSVVDDFFGFLNLPPSPGAAPPGLPADPTGAIVSVSLKEQMDALEGEIFHVNVIRVGSDLFSASDNDEVDYSIYRMRNIYAAIGIGIGRVKHYFITSADANGLDSPTKDKDLKDLTQIYSVPTDGIDLFIVNNMNIVDKNNNVTLGRSAVGGPCGDKDPVFGLSGSTCGLFGSEQTSRTAAHEIGHYLSLQHRNKEPMNLMCQSLNARSTRNSVKFDDGKQERRVRRHCFVSERC
jgi:hypothetical protein